MRILPRTEHGCAFLTVIVLGIPIFLLLAWAGGILVYEAVRTVRYLSGSGEL